MKKNRTMRVGAILLALVLITCCIVSSTLAKYIAGESGYDEARVALFNFGANGIADVDVFNDSMYYDEEVYASDPNDNVGFNGDNIIAPGTCGHFTFDIWGIAEVDTFVNFTIKETQSYSQEDQEDVPLVYFLSGRVGTDGTDVPLAFYTDYDGFLEEGKTYYLAFGDEADNNAAEIGLPDAVGVALPNTVGQRQEGATTSDLDENQYDPEGACNIYAVEFAGTLADYAAAISGLVKAGTYIDFSFANNWFWAYEEYKLVDGVFELDTDRDGKYGVYGEKANPLQDEATIERGFSSTYGDTELGMAAASSATDDADGSADLAAYVNAEAPKVNFFIEVEFVQVD